VFILDANVLIYALRRDSPFHQPCYDWLTLVLSQGAEVAAPSMVEVAVVRISSLPSLGAAATTPAAAFAFLRALREYGYYLLEPGQNHLTYWLRLCADLNLRGNDVNDAFLAALALEYQATLVSADEGFKRFKGLVCLNPLADDNQ
jgi:uncharacterized protein